MALNPRKRTPSSLRHLCLAVFEEECLECGFYTGQIDVAHIWNWKQVHMQRDYEMDAGLHELYSNKFHSIGNVVPFCTSTHRDYDNRHMFEPEEVIAKRDALLLNPVIVGNVARELEKLLVGRRTYGNWDGKRRLGIGRVQGGDERVLARWLSRAWREGVVDSEPVMVVRDRLVNLETGTITSPGGMRPTRRWWSPRIGRTAQEHAS